MKHNYSKIVFMALMAFGMKATAQCSSCTTTITGADSFDRVVTSGTTLCVSSTGTLSGLITVLPGGMLCNQGTISTSNVWVDGGTFNNYGTIYIDKLLASNGGGFNNYAPGSVDSLLVSGTSSNFTNYSELGDAKLAFNAGATGVNNGTISCGFFGDSSATFSNNANLSIEYDFYNAYNSTFTTSNSASYMSIGRDFYNSTGSTMTVGNCMIGVDRDWYNSATIAGPLSAGSHCGGFSITGGSYNSGTLGAAGQHVDLCDAGHPAGGVDGNLGTIASSTTFCVCANSCSMPLAGIADINASNDVLIKNVYPNPAVSDVTVEFNSKTEATVTVEVYDMMGKKLARTALRANYGDNKMNVDVAKFAAGTYILSITDEKGLMGKRMFDVVK